MSCFTLVFHKDVMKSLPLTLRKCPALTDTFIDVYQNVLNFLTTSSGILKNTQKAPNKRQDTCRGVSFSRPQGILSLLSGHRSRCDSHNDSTTTILNTLKPKRLQRHLISQALCSVSSPLSGQSAKVWVIKFTLSQKK